MGYNLRSGRRARLCGDQLHNGCAAGFAGNRLRTLALLNERDFRHGGESDALLSFEQGHNLRLLARLAGRGDGLRASDRRRRADARLVDGDDLLTSGGDRRLQQRGRAGQSNGLRCT